MKINRLILFVVSLLLPLFVSSGADARGTKQLTPEIKVNLMKLKAIRGTPVDASTFNGRPVLVTFFASWCPPCASEMRGFRDFIKENGPDNVKHNCG
jgi:thiol-disulfide isomerase/thioredoxin|tara:strand:- start:6231 stop:6521 length:291 start_codon:yes stop_codon:yes gene_type:complete